MQDTDQIGSALCRILIKQVQHCAGYRSDGFSVVQDTDQMGSVLCRTLIILVLSSCSIVMKLAQRYTGY